MGGVKSENRVCVTPSEAMEVKDYINWIHGGSFTQVKHKANDVLKLCYLLMFLEVNFLS